jgi:hypothetical protein
MLRPLLMKEKGQGLRGGFTASSFSGWDLFMKKKGTK